MKEFICTSTEPIVQTRAGKIRGYKLGTTYTFHGIKYADAKRFEMPQPVAPWDGVKDALSYGPCCPVMSVSSTHQEIRVPHRYWPEDEDCQYLNLWTQSLDRNAKKPVMVWIHGGGFDNGNSIEIVAYDGDELSVFGDVVVISINHRLNILGYLDVSAFGQKYWNSPNVGVADIVAALEWVRDNIEGFGGDPNNVTIFGQSGGGGKTCTLLQTPAAGGLFHRAIAQSGIHNLREWIDPETSKILVRRMLGYLGIDEANFDEFTKVPYDKLTGAYKAISEQMLDEGYNIPFGFAPQPNGWYLGDARFNYFSEYAKKVPLMVGSVIGEYAPPMPVDKETATEEQALALVREKYGDTADKLVELFRKAYPDKSLFDLYTLDSTVRYGSLDHVTKRSEFTDAPVYSYMFALDFTLDYSTPAWHCSEIPFIFHNAKLVPNCCMGELGEQLEKQIASTWVAFARTGNPNNPTIPEWPAFTPENKATMIMDRKWEVRYDYDRELVELHKAVSPSPMRAARAKKPEKK